MFRHNEEIDDRERLEVVIHQEQIWIVACGQPLAFGFERAVDECRALVISQDGPISIIWSEKEGQVNVRKGANLMNMNMPWA